MSAAQRENVSSADALDAQIIRATTAVSGGVDAENVDVSTINGVQPSQFLVEPRPYFPAKSVVSLFPYAGAATGVNYAGGVLAPNGKIYCAPRDVNTVLVIDPRDNSSYTIPLPGEPVYQGVAKYNGAVLAPNKKMYCITRTSGNVLVVDTETDRMEVITGFPTQNQRNYGGVLVGTKIYCGPLNSPNVMIIDTETNTVDTTSIILSPYPGTLLVQGLIAGPNYKLYTVPANSDVIFVVDPSTNTVTQIPTGLAGSLKFAVGALAPNGNIYCLPGSANYILVIEPATNTFRQILVGAFPASASEKWIGAVLGLDGKIYGIPYSATTVCVLDPQTETVSFIDLPAGANNYAGGVLAPNGTIYCVPRAATRVLQISTGLPTLPPWPLQSVFHSGI